MLSSPLRLMHWTVVMAVSVAGAGCAFPSPKPHGLDHAQAERTAFREAIYQSMDVMHRAMAAAPMTGEADQDFLAMMIPHHEGAIEMARLLLLHGRDPLVRQLAEEIIAGQQVEIDSMRARLALLRDGRGADPGDATALRGTRGPVEAPPRR